MKKLFAFTLFSMALVATGLQAEDAASEEVTQAEAPAEAPAAEEVAG